MKISSIEFLKSVAHPDQLPKTGLPEIAFAGRSNVGKSSLLNSLLNRKRLAHVSATPGKTRLLNFFTINNSFYFVDLPGYGFAKASFQERNAWKKLVEGYFARSSSLKGFVLLIDIRHNISPLDLELLEWISIEKMSVTIVGTKADKLSRNKLRDSLLANEKFLRENDIGKSEIIAYSSVTGLGKSELWKRILDILNQ